ncbi:hypothetical protein MY11210_008677 [Beauveria gryllotalpidicola]
MFAAAAFRHRLYASFCVIFIRVIEYPSMLMIDSNFDSVK